MELPKSGLGWLSLRQTQGLQNEGKNPLNLANKVLNGQSALLLVVAEKFVVNGRKTNIADFEITFLVNETNGCIVDHFTCMLPIA